jgi:hypothetical protein
MPIHLGSAKKRSELVARAVGFSSFPFVFPLKYQALAESIPAFAHFP